MVPVILSMRVVFYFKNFNLPKFCRYCNKTMILFYVVHMDMQHIRIKLALSIVEKLRCRFFHQYFMRTTFEMIKVNFINVELCIIPTDNEVMIVFKIKLKI